MTIDGTVLDDIHRYWFGGISADAPAPKERMDAWFRPTAEIDDHIRKTYGAYIEPAATEKWNLASLNPRRQAALIVLLDQFPRQIYRNDARTHGHDNVALALAKRMVDGGLERFFAAERMFVLLPFEHSEDIAEQDRGLMLFAAEAVGAPPERMEEARGGLDYAIKHRDIIRKFGRFPHRNALLGRESTPEEIEFLKGGRGF